MTGPWFGSGPDFFISGKMKSYANYVSLGTDFEKASKKHKTIFSDTYNFKIEEIEVYSI